MKALLDTHVFLWWVTADPRLSEKAVSFIAKKDNTIYFSAASCWEIAIKAKLGKLHLPGNNMDFIGEQLIINHISSLAITIGHAMQVYKLPDHHRDPFDRILAAQAQWEKIPIITADPLVAAYDVKTVW